MAGKTRALRKRSKKDERIAKMGARIQALHHEKDAALNKLTASMSYIRFEVVELRKLKRSLETERDRDELWDLANVDTDAAEAYYKKLLGEVIETLDRVLDPVELPEDEYLADSEIAVCDKCEAELDLEAELMQRDDGSVSMLCKDCKPTPPPQDEEE